MSTIPVVNKTLKSIIKLGKDSTNKNKKNSESVVCEHQLEFNHEFDWENTKIVDYVSDYRKRLTSEMIHIKFNKFSINKKEDIFTLNRIYFSLLNRLRRKMTVAFQLMFGILERWNNNQVTPSHRKPHESSYRSNIIIPKLNKNCILEIDMLKKFKGRINIEENYIMLRSENKELRIEFMNDEEKCIRLIHKINMEPNEDLTNIDPQEFANKIKCPEKYEEFCNVKEYDEIEEKYGITDAEIEEKVAKCELLNGEEKKKFWEILKKCRHMFEETRTSTTFGSAFP